ncbi:MAG: hypothetical protein HY591_00945 [Candidatus Omnitrophica bacterium]|nr:hypothetical protein [Candidatus Omnitrophota bacterium]
MSKHLVLVICGLITAGAVILAFYAFEKGHKLSKSLEEERYSRMVAEESSQKSAAKLAALDNQLKSTQDKMAKLKDILDQEKEVNQDLKIQYEQLVQAKEVLESRLKTAMEEKSVEAEQQAAVPPPAAEIPVVAAGAQ